MEYAKAKLFGPLGIKEMFWAHDPQGISMAGYGLYLQPGDTAKSDTAVPADAPSAKLLASKIADASTEKPTEVGPTSQLAAIISGKVYNFPPNQINLKSLTLRLTDPEPSYDIATYAQDSTKSGTEFTGPIGLDGLYGKGELSSHGYSDLFEGRPRVYVLKGAWQGDHTFVIDRLILGEGPTQISRSTEIN